LIRTLQPENVTNVIIRKRGNKMKNIHQQNNRRTFAFLKDRNIFNGGQGKGGLKEALTAMEKKTENGDRTRNGFKKARKK
jgi:hypothetical protein